MNRRKDGLPLLGYVDRLSARPAETLSFKVSSTASTPFKASLVRSISADPNPDGPGIIEEDADEYFKPREVPSRHRKCYPGSYAVAQAEVSVTTSEAIELSVNVFPTLKSNQLQAILSDTISWSAGTGRAGRPRLPSNSRYREQIIRSTRAAGASNSRWVVVGSRLTVKVFWL